jgi:hypothetical protein
MKGKENIRHHGAVPESGAEIASIGKRAVRQLSGKKLEPSPQTEASFAGHLDQAAGPVQRETGPDFEMHFIRRAIHTRLMTRCNSQTRHRSAAVVMNEREGKLATMIGLLVPEVVRSEQFTGRVVQALRRRLAQQRVRSSSHGRRILELDLVETFASILTTTSAARLR